MIVVNSTFYGILVTFFFCVLVFCLFKLVGFIGCHIIDKLEEKEKILSDFEQMKKDVQRLNDSILKELKRGKKK